MRLLLAVVFSLIGFAQLTHAEVYDYRLFSWDGEKTDLIFRIQLDGPFKKGSTVKSIRMISDYDGEEMPVFIWESDLFYQVFDKISWDDEKTLRISMNGHDFCPVVWEEFYALMTGDAPINPGNFLSFDPSWSLVLTVDGQKSDPFDTDQLYEASEGIQIDSGSYGETAVSGYLLRDQKSP